MKYMDLAVKIARGSDPSNKHFLLGCVGKRSDGALVVSTNIRTQHPMPSAHSEARNLKKCGFGATLWVARIDRLGNICLAKPCEWCQALCKNKRVKRIHYTISATEYGVMDF